MRGLGSDNSAHSEGSLGRWKHSLWLIITTITHFRALTNRHHGDIGRYNPGQQLLPPARLSQTRSDTRATKVPDALQGHRLSEDFNVRDILKGHHHSEDFNLRDRLTKLWQSQRLAHRVQHLTNLEMGLISQQSYRLSNT